MNGMHSEVVRIRRFAGRLERFVPPAAAVAAGVGFLLVCRTQNETVSEIEWSVPWQVVAASALAFMLAPLAQGLSFWLVLRLLTGRTPLLDAMLVWSRSYVVRYAPTGALAIAYRVSARPRLRASADQVLAAYAYEHVGALAAGAATCLVLFALAGELPPLLPLGVALVALALTVALRPGIAGGAVRSLANRFGLQLTVVLDSRQLAAVVGLNALGWLGTGTAVYLLVAAMTGSAPGFAWLVGSYTAGYLVGFVTPLAPGGLGAREGTLVLLLAPRYGVGVALGISLLIRVANVAGELLAVVSVHCVHAACLLRTRLRRTARLEVGRTAGILRVTLLALVVGVLAAGCAATFDSSGDREPDPWSIETSDTCPHWSPDGSSVAFSRSRAAGDDRRQYDAYIATRSGRARRITQTPESETVVGWLSDPARVVFLRGEGPHGAADVYQQAPDAGSRPRRLARLPKAIDPGYAVTLSADGRHLASEDSWEIVDLASSSAVAIEAARPYASGAAWSPDGRRLVFVGGDRGVHQFVVIADTNGRVVRTLGPAYLGDSPAWSPDGRWIAYANAAESLGFVTQVHVVRADGTGQRMITHRPDAENGLPVWSPDGRTIVYRHGGTLRKVDLDGGGDEQLSDPGGGADACATFSSDGSRIAFLRSAAGGPFSPSRSVVALMDADGSSQRAAGPP